MIQKRSNVGEEITDWERTILMHNKCPNCMIGDICQGPEGGGSINYRCNTCGQGYNLGVIVENIGIDLSWASLKHIRKLKLDKLNDQCK